MGKNNDDQPTGAESFDFAPGDAKKIGGPADGRFEKTAADPMAVRKRNTATNQSSNLTPGLTNSRHLTGDDMARPPDPYDENLTGLHIAQNYEILEKVGEGGMSAVYRARHMHLNREVAVKMLHPHLVSNRVSRERFSQEARAVSQIEHQNVVRLLDFGITEENRPYIVMDFLRGSALSQVIRQKGPLDIPTAISVFLQICDALAYTHDKGIVHRDLKPSNIILLEKRQRSVDPDNVESQVVAKIVDFGIAKLLPQEDAGMAALTQTGDVFGSPLYMSPEQTKGEKLDNRSDIYSMGCLMYETLTGVPPINGSNMLEILYRHMNEMPAPMNSVVKDANIPRNLEAIVFKALAKEPKDRYQDMRSLAEDLSKFANSGPGLTGSLGSVWSLYRSRRKRLNTREKIAIGVTTIATGALILCVSTFIFLYFKGTQDFSEDTEIAWLTVAHKNEIDNYYDSNSHMVSYSLRSAEARIQELRKQSDKGQPIESNDNDYETVQALLRNANELKTRDNLDDATAVLDKAIDLATLVHGTQSLITRQASVMRLMTLYQNKKYDRCISQIDKLQSDISVITLYSKTHFKALLYSILGESEYHLKNYEKARSDLLEALTNWEESDREKERTDPALLELKALSTSYFADCFAKDGMWEESVKYYQKAGEVWKQDLQPMSDYNQALALFKESLAYCHMNDSKSSEKLFKQAVDILHRHPTDFQFYQTEVEMMQISGRLDQEHGNWLPAVEKFIQAGLAKNRSNINSSSNSNSNNGNIAH